MIPSEPPSTPDGAPRRTVERATLDLGRFAGLGLQFVGTLALFGALGWWLDTRFGTLPWLLVTGIFGGGVIAFIVLVRSVPPAQNLPPERDSRGPRP